MGEYTCNEKNLGNFKNQGLDNQFQIVQGIDYLLNTQFEKKNGYIIKDLLLALDTEFK